MAPGHRIECVGHAGSRPVQRVGQDTGVPALGGGGSGSRWCAAAIHSRQASFSRRRYAEAMAVPIRHVAFSRPCREPVHRRHADSTRRRCTGINRTANRNSADGKSLPLSLVLATAVCHLDSADVKTPLKAWAIRVAILRALKGSSRPAGPF